MAQTKRGATETAAEVTEGLVGGYEAARIKLMICRQLYEIGALRVANEVQTFEVAYKEYLACTSEASKLAKETYNKLLPRLKKPDARSALKDLQVAYMLALESSAPKDGELKIHYRQRIAGLDEKVEAAMQRLKLEL